jgi:hypothetical protein
MDHEFLGTNRLIDSQALTDGLNGANEAIGRDISNSACKMVAFLVRAIRS